MRIRKMNDNTYNTIDAFIEAHEGLWSMIKDVTYKKFGNTLKIYHNKQFVKRVAIKEIKDDKTIMG